MDPPERVTVFFNNNYLNSWPTVGHVLFSGTALYSFMSLDPARPGFKFKEWNTAPDGSGTTFTADTIVTSDITVYAIWAESYVWLYYDKTYSFSFPNGGSSGYVVAVGSPLALTPGFSIPIPNSRQGYIFTGWNSQPDGSGFAITPSTVIWSTTTAYAQFEECLTADVTFNYNYSGGPATEVKSTTQGFALKPLMPLGAYSGLGPIFNSNGDVFKEWNTAPDGTGTVYDADSLVTGSITLYAQWVPRQAILSIDHNYPGALRAGPMVSAAGWSVGNMWPLFPGLNPVLPGFTLLGWNTEPDGSGEVFTADTKIWTNMTIYAQWKTDSPIFIELDSASALELVTDAFSVEGFVEPLGVQQVPALDEEMLLTVEEPVTTLAVNKFDLPAGFTGTTVAVLSEAATPAAAPDVTTPAAAPDVTTPAATPNAVLSTDAVLDVVVASEDASPALAREVFNNPDAPLSDTTPLVQQTIDSNGVILVLMGALVLSGVLIAFVVVMFRLENTRNKARRRR